MPRSTDVAGPVGTGGKSEELWQVMRRDRRRRGDRRWHKVRAHGHDSTRLEQASVPTDTFLIDRFLAGVGLHGFDARIRSRIQSSQIDHAATVDIPEVLARIVERLVVVRSAVHVNQKDPAESLLTEFRTQVHENGAQCFRSYGVCPGKRKSTAYGIGPVRAQRDLRKDTAAQPGRRVMAAATSAV